MQCAFFPFPHFLVPTFRVTPLDLHIERIPYDSEMVDSMLPKLDAFFINIILPKILGGDEISKENHEPSTFGRKFCVCQRGEFRKMVACDSTECEFTGCL